VYNREVSEITYGDDLVNEKAWLTCKDDPQHMLRFRLGELTMSMPKNWIATWAPPSDRQLRLFAQACAYSHPGTLFYPNMGGWANWADDGKRLMAHGNQKFASSVDAARWWVGTGIHLQVPPLPLDAEQKEKTCHWIRECFGNPFCPPSQWWDDTTFDEPRYPKDKVVDYSLPSSFLWYHTYLLTYNVLGQLDFVYLSRENNLLERQELLYLADLLEEAGCEYVYSQEACPACLGLSYFDKFDTCPHCQGKKHLDYGVLGHLRSPGPHPYGCWAVEWLLQGKKTLEESHGRRVS
jgi:hypothetical protein